MRILGGFILLALSHVAGAHAAVARCPATLSPTVAVPPRLPAMLHNEYAGSAEVAFLVAPSGAVSQPAILSLELHPVGHAGTQPKGYREALLDTVSLWRFPAQAGVCRKQVTITLGQATAGSR